MDNLVSVLAKDVCVTWLREVFSAKYEDNEKLKKIVSFHEMNLQRNGDVSFPTQSSVWQVAGDERKEEHSAEPDAKKLNAFVAIAKTWTHYPVREAKIDYKMNRCSLKLNREAVTKNLIVQSLEAGANYGYLKKDPRRRVCVLESPGNGESKENNLSAYRATLVKKTLKKMLEYSQWNVLDEKSIYGEKDKVLVLKVASLARRLQEADEVDKKKMKFIKCGIVTDPSTGKLIEMTTDEYIAARTQDMRLMAFHKYGIRFKASRYFNTLIERLGVAAVTIDLLEKKFSSPTPVISNGHVNSTKGAAFVLYNSARLETLLRTFDERVQSNAYGPLPSLEEVDFSALNSEEEWRLVFVFLFKLPNLFERCLAQIESGQLAVHLLILFLSNFVSAFSVYYRRTKILIQNRQHLMPQIYARIYLLKALRQLLNIILNILDIEPAPNM